MRIHRLVNRFRRRVLGAPAVTVWYEPRYRIPLAGDIVHRLGLEPRRADFALSYLLDSRLVAADRVRRPRRIGYDAIARVHAPAWIERLHTREGMAEVFGLAATDLPAEELLTTVRLAAGATLDAARHSLRRGRGALALNLLGGFHHAHPDRGRGFCPINDIAIALAVLRDEGFDGTVVVLDLDAHPPDGLAACLAADDAAHIGSISGPGWEDDDALADVDETVLAEGAGDGTYLAALAALLRRLPRADLVFVIAGGDVLAGDRLGTLGLTLEGVRRRDVMVAETFGRIPQVWLPGGGYSDPAWRCLAGTALALVGSRRPIPAGYDAIHAAYSRIARQLTPAELTRGSDLEMADILADLGVGHAPPHRLFGFYSEDGVEYALEAYGILGYLRRFGYARFRVTLRQDAERGRVRLFGTADGREHLLVETVLEIQTVGDASVLYVHWHTQRDGARAARANLPGQEHPGLGLAQEGRDLFAQAARRLGLAGVAFTPSFFHVAYLARERASFVALDRQARFVALLRDLGHRPLSQLSAAVDEGRVTMNGAPYTWEADPMVGWLDGPVLKRDAIDEMARDYRFALGRR
ncbi:MAG: histone deacetylase [Myxococcota bacterium]